MYISNDIIKAIEKYSPTAIKAGGGIMGAFFSGTTFIENWFDSLHEIWRIPISAAIGVTVTTLMISLFNYIKKRFKHGNK